MDLRLEDYNAQLLALPAPRSCCWPAPNVAGSGLQAILHMGSCQNYGPFLGPDYNTAPIIYGTQKGTLILTTTHINLHCCSFCVLL